MTSPDSHRPPLPFVPVLAALLVLLAIAVVVAPTVGPAHVSLSALWDDSIAPSENTSRQILMTIRLPRILFGVVAGAVLAIGGAVFQALMRNDLATPYSLGVSGGAAFGALIAINTVAVLTPVGALIGGGVAVAAILVLASRPPGAERMGTLLLAGVTMNLLFGAGIQIVQYKASPFEVFGMVRWMMGGLDVADVRVPLWLTAPLVAGFAILMANAQAMNVMTLGDATAAHLGFHPNRRRMTCIVTASAMTALVVAFAGPVGFVGLIIPHAMRRLVGHDHRRLLPCTMVAGAAFLVACDTLARAIGGDVELPVGIVTACVGGPFFLWILFRRGLSAG